jgi:proton glutamate symport protein
MFKVTSYVMLFAPVGVFAAVAATVGGRGLGILLTLGKLVAVYYAGLVVFVLIVVVGVSYLIRVPFWSFARAIREPFLIAFTTASSEAALPKSLEVMEKFGVPKAIVAFVLPLGYSFNLDGSTLYLAMASVFIAQAAETTTGQHMGLSRQILMMMTLMITSKGLAGVPRAAMVILLATAGTFVGNLGPIGVAVIFGVDELMDMGRTAVNVVGNCLATCVIARSEGEFDDERARVFGTPEEARLDLAEGEPAFARSVAMGD